MIKNYNILIDKNNRLEIPAITDEMGIVCKYSNLNMLIDHCFPWHWHPFLEINYVQSGSCLFQVGEDDYVLEEGNAIFINSNVMHLVGSPDPSRPSEELTLMFYAGFLAGRDNSVFDKNYISPVIQNMNFDRYLLLKGRDDALLAHVLHAIDLHRDEPFGYEMMVRNELSSLWLQLFQKQPEVTPLSHAALLNDSRIRTMMEYIQSNFAEKITLEDIARSGSVSVRECTRSFQRFTKMPPIEYLNYYRLREAARQLLQNRNSISFISESCGFSSPGYFCRIFKKAFDCTPREYQKLNVSRA